MTFEKDKEYNNCTKNPQDSSQWRYLESIVGLSDDAEQLDEHIQHDKDGKENVNGPLWLMD